MADDPATEAIVRECLHQLDAASADDARSYEDALYRLQAALFDTRRASQDDPPAEVRQAVMQALARLHPSADDHLIGYGEQLQRLRTRVDVELSRWTSGMVQPTGPSGATAVAEAPAPPQE